MKSEKLCYFCDMPVTEMDYCFGCEEYVCKNCHKNDTLMGSHDVEEHLDEPNLYEEGDR